MTAKFRKIAYSSLIIRFLMMKLKKKKNFILLRPCKLVSLQFPCEDAMDR